MTQNMTANVLTLDARRIAEAKRADAIGKVARTENATITRLNTGVRLETRYGKWFFPLENSRFGTVDAMFLDFIDSWSESEVSA